MSQSSADSLMERISDSLKQLKNQGLSNAKIGDRIGVTENTIKNWIDRKTSPNAHQLQIIADLTGKDLLWFYNKAPVVGVNEQIAAYAPMLSDREIGRLEGKIEELEKQVIRYEKRLSKYDTEIKEALEKCAAGLRKQINSVSNARGE